MSLFSRRCFVLAVAVALGAPALLAQTAAIPIAGTLVAVPGGSFTNIDAPTLAAMLKSKDFFFVNVHIPYAGEIAGTDAFIPFDQTKASLGTFPRDRKAKIVLYCRSGRMSDIAARELALAGFSKVFNLEGGMDAWQEAGFRILQSKR